MRGLRVAFVMAAVAVLAGGIALVDHLRRQASASGRHPERNGGRPWSAPVPRGRNPLPWVRSASTTVVATPIDLPMPIGTTNELAGARKAASSS